MIPLIPQYVLAIVFLCSASVYVFRKQYEHFITRFSIALFYVYLSVFPNLPLELTRAISRYLFCTMAFIEIFSAFIIFYVQQRRRGRK
jgi:hypothetical protein